MAAYRNWDITEGVYFGTRYITGGIDFTDDVKHKIETWTKENIFAFDALIWNVDRTPRKKNLFLANDTIYLIDHELSLSIRRSFDDYIRSNDWVFLVKNPKGDKHLFFNDLSTANKKDKLMFEQFAENLRTLKPELLTGEAEQLFENGISIDDYLPISLSPNISNQPVKTHQFLSIVLKPCSCETEILSIQHLEIPPVAVA